MNQPRPNLISFTTLPTQENRLILPSRLGNAPGLFTSAGGGMVAYALPPGVNVPQNMQNIPNLSYTHSGGPLQGQLGGGQTFVLNNLNQLQSAPNMLHMPMGAGGAVQFVQTSAGLPFQQQNLIQQSSAAGMPSFVTRPSMQSAPMLGRATTQPAGNVQQTIRLANVVSAAASEAQKAQQQKTATSIAAAAAANRRRQQLLAAKAAATTSGSNISTAAASRPTNDVDAARGQKRAYEPAQSQPTFNFDIDDPKSEDYSSTNASSNFSTAAKRKPPPTNNSRSRKPVPLSAAQTLQQQAMANAGNKTPQQFEDAARHSAPAVRQDDYYDVVNLGGVSSAEESQQLESSSLKVEAIRSNLPETYMLNKQAVLHIMQDVGTEQQDVHVSEVIDDDVVRLMTLAAEQKLRSIIEQLAVATEHRLENVKNHPNWAECSDLRAQLLFIAKAEKAELVRRGDTTLTAGSSGAAGQSAAGGGAGSAGAAVRASVDEAEIQRLRELQRRKAEEAKTQQANQAATTALAGSVAGRRRPQIATLATPPTSSARIAPSGRSIGTGYRPHVKRVKLVDLAFVFENDVEWRNTARYWDVMHAIALAEAPDEKARGATSTLGSLANVGARLALDRSE